MWLKVVSLPSGVTVLLSLITITEAPPLLSYISYTKISINKGIDKDQRLGGTILSVLFWSLIFLSSALLLPLFSQWLFLTLSLSNSDPTKPFLFCHFLYVCFPNTEPLLPLLSFPAQIYHLPFRPFCKLQSFSSLGSETWVKRNSWRYR